MNTDTSSRQPITTREWLWLAIASLLVMAFFSIPYVIGLYTSTPDMVFGGHIFNLSDMHSYLAKMREGADGGWTYTLAYTHEPHRPAVTFPLYLAAGKLTALLTGQGARVTADALTVAFHVMRVLCGLALLVSVYAFAAYYLDEPPKRRMAWALGTLAAGVGWIPFVISVVSGQPEARLPVSYYIPEAFSVLLFYGLPHLALARALLLLGWLAMFQAAEDGRWQAAWLPGLLWTLMAIANPIHAPILGVLIGGWLAGLWIIRRAFPLNEFRLSALSAALPALSILYNIWAFSRDPIYAAWSARNQLPSPPVIDYVLAFGPLLLLAVPGVVHDFRSHLNRRTLLLLVWPVMAALLVYAPINIQRRLMEGVTVPLAVLAIPGIWRFVGDKPGEDNPKLGWRLRQVVMGGLLSLLVAAPLMLVGGGALEVAAPEWPIYHSREEREALDWLRRNAPEDAIVLSTHETSSLLPAYASVRAYVGHGPETIDLEEKQPIAKAFFLGGMSDRDRIDLLRDIDATYVFVGPNERLPHCREACFEPAGLGLFVAYRGQGYIIYQANEVNP